jgi:hypothetical protein
MGDLAAGDQQRVQAVHDRRPLLVSFGRMVTWRLCSADQVGPVVHMCAGKAKELKTLTPERATELVQRAGNGSSESRPCP